MGSEALDYPFVAFDYEGEAKRPFFPLTAKPQRGMMFISVILISETVMDGSSTSYPIMPV